MKENCIWVIDFGSQYTQLITKKTRQLGYKSILTTVKESLEAIKKGIKPLAIVLSGGPQSVSHEEADMSPFFEQETIPILGICYGFQILTHFFSGKIKKGQSGEYGSTQIEKTSSKHLNNLPKKWSVWMSHFDVLSEVPKEFDVILKSHNGLVAGIKHKEKAILGLQFHPEVSHSEYGLETLEYFFKTIAGIKKNWLSENISEDCYKALNGAKESYILCAFSGGVDSLVAATLTHKVASKRLFCFFVDNGLLREQDYLHIETLKEKSDLQIISIDAKKIFLERLKNIKDPEEKRKIIGHAFIDVFEKTVKDFQNEHGFKFEYLLQGTLYPDVIESSVEKNKKNSHTIKSHHNVGGLPESMQLKLLEPLRELYKDEVREIAKELKLPKEWIYRHPFPGPGLAVRIMGAVDEKKLDILRHSDQILFEEMKLSQVYDTVWQAFTVYLPIKTVGIKGDKRAYEDTICIRIVESSDGMTAKWSYLPRLFLEKTSSRLTNELDGITRVVYDITTKPPGTIEWE